ncbi:hypothetical protein OSB04_025205 [Centaurea solstitialis]|uniref:DUF8040 domain-containing protein n=1 Tax=Centaurea solstitialis TaxID=347529 RepID=A0AA38T730_9ASTR|nr:hypothetical protein OSB04_025205 [Centaurea solstitialis]
MERGSLKMVIDEDGSFYSNVPKCTEKNNFNFGKFPGCFRNKYIFDNSFTIYRAMDRNHLIILVTIWSTYIQMRVYLLSLIMLLNESKYRDNERENLGQRTFTRLQVRSTEIQRVTCESDVNCINKLKIDRNVFARLCDLLKTCGGLLNDGNITIEEHVAIFINTLAHHTKNRTIQVRFYRLGETISRYVHRMLCALLRLEDVLLVKPTPIQDDCTDSRWKWFKGCLGAINGTYIKVRQDTEQERDILQPMKVRLLTQEFYEIQSRLKVVPSNYYLADAGYINDEDFLAPYRGIRNHLQEWEDASRAPTTKEEYFNMKHSHVRNIIERTYMTTDPHENSTLTTEDMPTREDHSLPSEFIDVVEANIVINGGRGDNGSFRLGTYEAVVSKMHEKIPGISITSKHVQNKISV